jgi:outer membrane protein
MDAKLLTKTIFFTGLMLVSSMGMAELKIGFVNVAKVLESAPQAASAKKRLEKEFSPRDKLLVAQQKEIKRMEEKMNRDAAVMGPSERSKMEVDIRNKIREIKRSQEEFQEDFNRRRNEELAKLQRRVFEAIKALAKEEKFDLLLTDGVIYASDKINVTSKIEEKLAR